MALTDGRGVPLGKLYLWAPGQADPFLAERESAVYDCREEAFNAGTVSYVSGLPALEYVEVERGRNGAGALTSRPQLHLQDTRIVNYALYGGGWEERLPTTGANRKYRLVQYDGTSGVQWAAESSFTLPAHPNVAFSLAFIDSPPDWDETTYPPYVQLTFAGGRYCIYITKSTAVLGVNLGAGLVPVKELGQCQSSTNSDNGETLIVLRCVRGMIGVSVNGGERYTWWGNPDAGFASLDFPAGAFRIEGQGGMIVFGLHQLYLPTGTWLAPPRSTRLSHTGPLLFEPRGDETYGTAAFQDESTPTDRILQYSAELTPAATPLSGVGWSVYRSPEVYGVTARYAAVPSLYGFTGTRFEQPGLELATITKPRDLDGAGGSAQLRLYQHDPVTGAPLENWWNFARWTKFELQLGHEAAGGGDELETALVGFVTDVQITSASYNDVTLRLTLSTVAERFRQAKWSKLDTFPLGGRTLNQALDLILETEGVPRNNTYRDWDYVNVIGWAGLGDLFQVDAGSPEDPCEWPRAGENKWETMQRLAGYVGLEVVPLDNGILTTVPKRYVPVAVSWTYKALPLSSDELQRLVMALTWRLNSKEAATSVLLDGKDAAGNVIFAYATDTHAEQNPLSPRFSPFRVEAQDSQDGTTSIGMLQSRAAEVARDLFNAGETVDLLHPVDLRVSRLDRVRIQGFEHANLPADLDFQIRTLTHTYKALGGFTPELTTQAGLELTPSVS